MTKERLEAIAQEVMHNDPRPDKLKDYVQRVMPEAFRWYDDPGGRYYRFLYALAIEMNAWCILELGFGAGLSAACFGMAIRYLPATAPNVYSVEKNPPNIELLNHTVIVHADANDWWATPEATKLYGKVDIVFMDADHKYEDVLGQYGAYWQFLKPGGVMLFDDIDLSEEMRRAWRDIPGDKITLNHLHGTGFGARIK